LTLFNIGKIGTLLISKRPKNLHSILLKHSRTSSKSFALDVLSSQLEWIGSAISSNENENNDNGESSNAPLASGKNCNNMHLLNIRCRKILNILKEMKTGINNKIKHEQQEEENEHEDYDRHERSEENVGFSPQEGAIGGGTTAYNTTNAIETKDPRVLELLRLLQINQLQKSILVRADILINECDHLLQTTSIQCERGLNGTNSNGIGNSVTNHRSGNGSSGSERIGDSGFGNRGGGGNGNNVTNTTIRILLSGIVAFLAIEASVVNETLPWGQARDNGWSYLIVCVLCWFVTAVVSIVLPSFKCCQKYCSGSTIGTSKSKGSRINIKVVPNLRINTTQLERQLLSSVNVLEDGLVVPRFAIGGGGSSGNGGHAGENSKRQRKGCRTVIFKEKAINLNWPSQSIWKGRSLIVKMVLLYDNNGGGNGNDGGDIATLTSLLIEMDAAPPNWPFKWLHELILSKFLARFEDLNIISLEDHHVCRQILRLSNTVGTGSGR